MLREMAKFGILAKPCGEKSGSWQNVPIGARYPPRPAEDGFRMNGQNVVPKKSPPRYKHWAWYGQRRWTESVKLRKKVGIHFSSKGPAEGKAGNKSKSDRNSFQWGREPWPKWQRCVRPRKPLTSCDFPVVNGDCQSPDGAMTLT